MKYIVINKSGMELAILFPDQVKHSEVVDRDQVKVVAAGFVRQTPDGGAECYGASVSLGVASRGALDAEAMLFTMGLMEGQVTDFRGVGAEEQAI